MNIKLIYLLLLRRSGNPQILCKKVLSFLWGRLVYSLYWSMQRKTCETERKLKQKTETVVVCSYTLENKYLYFFLGPEGNRLDKKHSSKKELRFITIF